MRGRRAAAGSVAGLTVQLPYREPFDLQALLDFFSLRAIPGVECVLPGRYLRSIVADKQQGVVDLQDGGNHVLLTVHGAGTRSLLPVIQRVRGMFDLDASPDDIAGVLSQDRFLKSLLKNRPGIRVPGAWDGFELTVRAILGQQVSVAAATTFAGRNATDRNWMWPFRA